MQMETELRGSLGEPLDQDAPRIPSEGEKEGRLGASILGHCAD